MTDEIITKICSNAITQRKGQAVCSSLDVAEHFHKRHKNVLQTIETKILLNVSDEFNRLNFQPSSYCNQQNKKQPMYYMTRDGFTLLAMGFSGKEAMAFKVAYINAFNHMEQLLQERSTPAFLELREEGKRIRRMETDAIREFVEYARANGSHSPEWYYKSFSSMTNKLMGITARGEAGADQEQKMQLAESVVAAKIRSGIEKGREYKEIYKDCKAALEVVFA